MNPDLQAKLVQYLDKLEAGLQAGGAFAEREVPELIREWLLWIAVESFAYAAGLAALAALTHATGRRLLKAARALPEPRSEYDDGKKFAIALSWAVAHLLPLPPLIAATPCAATGAKALVAPRVVIVEKVANLARSAGK